MTLDQFLNEISVVEAPRKSAHAPVHIPEKKTEPVRDQWWKRGEECPH